MSRKTNIVSLLLLLVPFLPAQQTQPSAPVPAPEDSVTSRQLIMWTWMQKPQPTPQPLPPPDKPLPPSGQQPVQSANPNTPSPAKQVFIGKIVMDGDQLILRTSDGATYLLDEQRNLSQYQDRNVRIHGTLDATSNTIHVVKIELLS